jgi:phosphoribosylaminoimidazolecarboxamide formyltransferase/IMP cyclohydrolase
MVRSKENMPTALISVSNKIGIVNFAIELRILDWNIIASFGTAEILKKNSIQCQEISEITKFPEILDGRVKTLDPKIHGGILAIRSKENHLKQLKRYEIEIIDMVVVSLYPFEATINEIPKPSNRVIDQTVIENIDIGGVALLRAAAKNYKDVITICDVNDYEIVVKNLKNSSITEKLRLDLAAKAFRHSAYYDSLISNYLTYEKFPSQITIPLKKLSKLRYGENPHQDAALYFNTIKQNNQDVVKQLHGKELSYNNYLDLDSAWCLVNEFDNTACAIVKHTNPCGCAEGINVKDAYLKALSCDSVSAFGGVVGINKLVDEDAAVEVSKLFVECIIAPGYSKKALDVLCKKKNIRILTQELQSKKEMDSIEYKKVMYHGMLAQDKDNHFLSEIRFVTKRHPTKEEEEALYFAWKVSKHVKSNAIVLARGKQTVGIGAGQMSRIDSMKIAFEKMKNTKHGLDEKTFPLVLASDAFLPFSDVVEKSIMICVTAIMQPGGSIRDDESINAANNGGIAMVFTGMRHFKH